MARLVGGFGGTVFVAGARCSFADEDAGRANTHRYWRNRGRRSAGEQRGPAAQPLSRRSLLPAAAVALALVGAAGATPRGTEVEQLHTRAKVVALTFDGAWDDSGVPRIVAALKRYHATATFFVTGSWVKRYPAVARRVGRLYPIANHSWSHPQMTGLSDAAIRKEIRRASWWIRAATGRTDKPLFRFPYGDRNARTIRVVNAMGYTSVRWSLDTWGWMGPPEGQSKQTVLHRVATMLSPGDILLLHIGANRDGSTLDADALPAILDLLKRRGYRTVTLDRYVTAPK